MKKEIKDKFTNNIIYESIIATNIKEAVEEAVNKKVNLSGAYLSGADLVYCKMDKKVFKQITEDWFKWEIK
jgi:uncharacterized protein YjbI with pentapeptide repeats